MEYTPAEDTFALLDALPKKMGSVVEIGCGSCYILGHINAKFKVGCDINRPKSIDQDTEFVISDGRKLPFRHDTFDLALFNPPYLPSEKIIDPAVDGGRGGVEIALLFLYQSLISVRDGGEIFVLLSSLSDLKVFKRTLENLGMTYLEKRKRLFFEELHVFTINVHKSKRGNQIKRR